MVCENRPYLCGILILGSLALFFHIVGFVTPGWLILRRSMMEDESIFEVKGQLIDKGGVTPPPEWQDDEPMFRKRRSHDDHRDSDSSDSDGKGHHHGNHHERPHHQDPHHGGKGPHPPHKPGSHPGHQGPHSGPHPPKGDSEFSKDNDDLKEEMHTVQQWIMKATSEIETFDVRTNFGLWYSKVCVHKRRQGDSDSKEKHEEDEDWSSSSEDDDDRKGHCRCKKISTKCALYYAFIYENNFFFPTKTGGNLSYRNFGYASLTEHRAENCLVLAFLVLGLISAVIGFRKVNGCKYAGAACVVFMLVAAFLAIVPVARLSHYSVIKTQHGSNVNVHAPYSVIATGVGALFALITALVAGYGLKKKSRKGPGAWYQFNNELELPGEKKEKLGIFVSAEALPAKPGLYDVCDFSDIKPVEEVKKPVEAEEPDEFVL